MRKINLKGVYSLEWRIRNSDDGNPNHKHWQGFLSGSEMVSILHMNEERSWITRERVPLVHWGILILGCSNSERKGKMGIFREPTYREKLNFLQEVGHWKLVAVEVMPRRENIVDRADVYHMFELTNPVQFTFDYKPIFETPSSYLPTYDDKYEYFLKGKSGSIEYLYLRRKDGKELRWWEKQNLKDCILGAHRCAMEVIIRGMENRDYTALICLPTGRDMGFTLI